ncbi:RnfH family protein [Piscinibacter sakaiensis]|uniref:UPF0125 protein ISF6_4788 n=1 Tax=Piscinibacter sakaiensis TaxID=1547922 RepID=A0A0K8P807_PISS1|nr:RnfH family protein [Piscinibacter sakaiensis]GAP38330.1 hypothetical protein ISF6_4788 [Piscinibacter sakaiensis]
MSAEAPPEGGEGGAGGRGAGTRLQVEVVYAAGRGRVERHALSLPAGATAGDAVARSGVREGLAAGAPDLALSVWGRRADPSRPLADGDRVELTRPLLMDPGLARRARHRAQQGPKAAASRALVPAREGG